MGKLMLVGCGKMGGAMLEGWLARGLAASDVIVAEPVEALRPRKDGLRCVASSSDIRETPEIVVLAVKPQTMDAVLPDLRRFADSGAVFLSIGTDLDQLVATDQYALVPAQKKELISGSGHIPMIERPEEFNRVLNEFLTGH